MISQNTNDESAYKGSGNLFAFHSYVHSFFFFVVYITHRAPRDKFDVANNNKGEQVEVALLTIWFTRTPLPLRVSTSSQTEIICKASAFALVRSSESFMVFSFLVKFLLRKSEVTRIARSEVVRYAHSEVKFAPKLLLTCTTCGANFTSAVAETSLHSNFTRRRRT